MVGLLMGSLKLAPCHRTATISTREFVPAQDAGPCVSTLNRVLTRAEPLPLIHPPPVAGSLKPAFQRVCAPEAHAGPWALATLDDSPRKHGLPCAARWRVPTRLASYLPGRRRPSACCPRGAAVVY